MIPLNVVSGTIARFYELEGGVAPLPLLGSTAERS